MASKNDKDDSKLVKVRLRFVGPLKRSTFQKKAPDSKEEIFKDLLHWSWSVRLQIERLSRDIPQELNPWCSETHYKLRRNFSKTSCDEHLLLVVATNLDRALNRLSKKDSRTLKISDDSRRALRLLRNVYEHWDIFRGQLRKDEEEFDGALAKLRSEFPDADPWSITIDRENDDLIIADVIALKPLVKELRRLEARILRLERARKQKDGGST